jgi:ATP-dependent protease ClpP protease subunit
VPQRDDIPEIAFTGDLTERENDLTQHLLDVPPGGSCLLYFDSPGGNPYVGLSLMSLMLLRDMQATGIVTGECSSAALWPLAACRRRFVTPYSVLLFHPMKWQSEENVGLAEAAEWARHFGDLEKTMDQLLAELFGASQADMARWMQPGRYLTGREIVEAGLAEMVGLEPLKFAEFNGASRRRKHRT